MKSDSSFNQVVISLFLLALSSPQNPALAVVNQEKLGNLQINLGLDISQKFTKKQPIQIVQIADTTKYVTPQKDAEISMPGDELENTKYILMTTNTTTQTIYLFSRKDLPLETLSLNNQEIREILQIALRATFSEKDKVVKSTNMVFKGYPGIELVVQHSDGTQGQYQGYVVRRRFYILGARTSNELTTEAANFFDSFRVYPTRIVSY